MLNPRYTPNRSLKVNDDEAEAPLSVTNPVSVENEQVQFVPERAVFKAAQYVGKS
jgi:hypothetical protein